VGQRPSPRLPLIRVVNGLTVDSVHDTYALKRYAHSRLIHEMKHVLKTFAIFSNEFCM
jgi:hypothetical protein